jgi:hypothetical protein
VLQKRTFGKHLHRLLPLAFVRFGGAIASGLPSGRLPWTNPPVAAKRRCHHQRDQSESECTTHETERNF